MSPLSSTARKHLGLGLVALFACLLSCAKPYDGGDKDDNNGNSEQDAGGDGDGDGDGDVKGDGDGDVKGDGDGDVKGDGDGDITSDAGSGDMCMRTCSSLLNCDVFGSCHHTKCDNGMCM